jgi:hypothetical protein
VKSGWHLELSVQPGHSFTERLDAEEDQQREHLMKIQKPLLPRSEREAGETPASGSHRRAGRKKTMTGRPLR